MRILFMMSHPGVNSFTPALRLLAERGHEIELGFQWVKTGESHRTLERVAAECPGLTFGQLPLPGRSDWSALASELRYGTDYLRYLEPRYRAATKLRARAERRAPTAIRRAGRLFGLRPGLQGIERTLPPPASAVRYLAEKRPDVLLITPLVELGSAQADWLRAAKRLGIRTGYPVFSWDNLTNKGLLRDIPDLVIVWNELQADEAVELHGVARERIRVTGAQSFDHWFGWEPSRTREQFCAEVGLRTDRPILLYLCSSGFVAPGEPEFVRSWIDRLRARGGEWAEVGFLIRPHPLESTKWTDWSSGPQVTVWPRLGEDPHEDSWRRNYYDSIFHAAGVVGINTTAQIEAAIVGRPVHTLLAPEFRETQAGTLHFHYLQADGYGHLFVGRTFDEHAEQLEETLRGRPDGGRNERFLHRFVRPLGVDVSASERFAAAVEELGSRSVQPDPGPALAPLVRLAARPFAAAATRRAAARGEQKTETPARELQRTVRRLSRDRGGALVLAPLWRGDEVAEILYWVPFLRWAQTATFGLRERLVVERRPEHAEWYTGIGARQVDPGDAPEAKHTLSPELVAAARSELAGRGDDRRIQHRLLDFAPLETRNGSSFTGAFGPAAIEALLSGHDALVVAPEPGAELERDLEVVRTFLDRPPYGRLEVVEHVEAVAAP
jgi:hypothetical protein